MLTKLMGVFGAFPGEGGLMSFRHAVAKDDSVGVAISRTSVGYS